MPALVIQIIIALAICGFIYWVFLLLMPFAPIAEPFAGLIKAFVLILIGAVVLFYVLIPVLNTLGHMNFGIR